MANEHQAAAQAEIDRIDAQIDSWREQLVVKRREFDAAQAGAGQRVLAGTTTPAKIAAQQALLRDELVAIEQVIAALQEQRVAAQRARLVARLEDTKDEQQRMRDEVAQREERRKEILALLQEFEGPNAQIGGETQTGYLYWRINNFDHGITHQEYQLAQFDAQDPEVVPVPVAA